MANKANFNSCMVYLLILKDEEYMYNFLGTHIRDFFRNVLDSKLIRRRKHGKHLKCPRSLKHFELENRPGYAEFRNRGRGTKQQQETISHFPESFTFDNCMFNFFFFFKLVIDRVQNTRMYMQVKQRKISNCCGKQK